jgi:hypothetical protein
MRQRDYELTDEPVRHRPQPAPPRRTASPVAELQRSLGGNQGTANVLARKGGGGKKEGTFEHSVRIGKLGPIEIKDSNVDDFTSQNGHARDLTVTTAMGKHSHELEKMGDAGKIDAIEVTTVTGQNTWIVVTFKHGLIKDYAADKTAKTETWKLTRFDAIDIKRLAIGSARP